MKLINFTRAKMIKFMKFPCVFLFIVFGVIFTLTLVWGSDNEVIHTMNEPIGFSDAKPMVLSLATLIALMAFIYRIGKETQKNIAHREDASLHCADTLQKKVDCDRLHNSVTNQLSLIRGDISEIQKSVARIEGFLESKK